MSDTVLLDIADGVAVVTLNRPDRLNALNGEIMDALTGMVSSVVENPDVGVIVLTGAGRGFCAGGDTKDGGQRRANGIAPPPELTRGLNLRRNAETSRLLREAPKVTIAMVNGPVAGAGIGLAGACDLRFAAESATFLSAYDKIGGAGDYGATYVWARILGAAKAFGLYHRVYPDAELRERTLEAARKLAAGPRSGWAYMKQNLNAAEDESFTRHLDRESANMGLATQAYFSALKAQRAAAG